MSAEKRPPSKHPDVRAPLDTLDRLDSLRPSSLPPELGELDFSWDDDVVAQPKAQKPVFSPLELDLELDEGERPTAIPDIPMELFVAQAMAKVDEQERLPPSSLPPFSESLSGPPTMKHGPERSRPIQAYYPIPQLRPPSSIGQATLGSAPHTLDPLALDMEEIDTQRCDAYLMPTDAPEAAAPTPAYPTTMAPPQDDLHAKTDVEQIGPATLPPHEDNSRPLMKDRYAMGDFTGALEIAESLLAADASDLEAQRYATSCRDVLTQMYLSRLGGLDQVINVVLPAEELRWLNLDHRAGFLLSLVDGFSTIEELLDISGMSRLDALKILSTLREQRAILLSTR